MTSGPTKFPSQGGKLSRSQREAQQRDQFFAEITSENMQLKRTLWLLLHTTGKQTHPNSEVHSIILDQADMSPLWDLKFTNPEDEPTKLALTAQLLPMPSDDQMRKLHESLVGTNKDIREFLKDLGLEMYPTPFLISSLTAGVGSPESPPQLAPLRWDAEKTEWVLFGL